MKKNMYKLMLCVQLIMMLTLSLVMPCTAQNTYSQVVRVGYFAYDGYNMQYADGTRSGYGYDVMQRLAGYAGLRYEYVGYDKSWDEMLAMLERGEIDVLGTAQMTEDRLGRFAFTDRSIGVSSAMLTVKAGDERFTLKDSREWNGIRVGMRAGSSRNAGFAAFAAAKGFTYKPVYYQDSAKMTRDLQSGGIIDAVLTSSLRRIKNGWVVARYDSAPFYLMLNKNNAELLSLFNIALKKMDANEPGFRTDFYNKYYLPSRNTTIPFSLDELEYIQKMKSTKLLALISPDRKPYSWFEGSKWRGIVYDYARLIALNSGLNIDFVIVNDRADYERYIDTKTVDIRFDAESNINQAERDGFWLTAPYAHVSVGRLYRKDNKDFLDVALPKNRDVINTYGQVLSEQGKSLMFFDSLEDLKEGLLNKKVGAAYLAMDTATMIAKSDITNKLIAEEIYGEEIGIAIGVNQKEDPLLFSVLSKVIASLDTRSFDTIRQDYANILEKQHTLLSYFYDYPLQVTAAIVLLVGIILAFIVAYSQYTHRKKEHAYFEREQEQTALLKDALAAAEHASIAKGKFLSSVSYEMRMPLNAIIGFIELAKDKDKDTMQHLMASSELAAKQLLSVINDVLDMSSIESGKMKIVKVPFNFRFLVSSITNIYETQCKQKDLVFETKITTPIEDWLLGDELRVNQILLNLLSNAVKFTNHGHIYLFISQTAIDDSKMLIRFVVEDTGCGMSEEVLERVFKPFEQADDVRTAKRFGGSGLGLLIVHNLVSMMQGSITVESKQGEGTKFVVDLPFEHSDVIQEEILPANLETLRVLAVDDEDTELEYMSLVLNRMGIQFDCVNSGKKAIEALDNSICQNQLYNVCLIDWSMPELDGFETAKLIRQKYGKDIVIIILSAYDFQEVGAKAKAVGANMVLPKPIFPSSLYDLFMMMTGGKIVLSSEQT